MVGLHCIYVVLPLRGRSLHEGSLGYSPHPNLKGHLINPHETVVLVTGSRFYFQYFIQSSRVTWTFSAT